jgi:hypothetical protein
MTGMKRFQAEVFQAFVLGLLAASAACAQPLNAAGANFPNHWAGLRIDRTMLAGPLAESPRTLRVDGTTAIAEPREVSLIGSSVMLEMARVTPDGRYVRPRVVIGQASPELKSWLSSVGIPAERCMLPLVRGRIKRNQDTGDVGAALWVSARCSFY